MGSKFKEFDKKYASLMGTALKTIEKSHGSIAKEDIEQINSWPFNQPLGSSGSEMIRFAVYEAPDAEEWQKFRVSLKGLSTKEKLYCLAWYLAHVENDFGRGRIRVRNYLGALVRGGQLDSKLRIVR